MKRYDPKKIEPKWQKYWATQKTFAVKEDKKKEKFYGLIEFPYPSGEGLHVGHPRPFTAMDVISRKKRMEGKNVLFPIGFDAFGLPTENFAIKTGKPPAEVTKKNIANFTRQLKMLGFSFDWSRQVDTTDPNYYKWTQWLFLQFYKHGLAYKKNQPINWCPKDKIGLANEEVVNGCCERCGTAVEKRNKEQWMLAITKYADKLLEGLKDVNYIERARVQQENWIGKSEGAEVVFPLHMIPGQPDNKHSVTVFTTRPDTIFGVTFLAISVELAQSWVDIGWQASEDVKKYITETVKDRAAATTREEQEKTGVNAGIVAINPVSKEQVPVWITNYVMGGVGTGAIMGVPAHDERDFDFATKFGLPIKQVVAQKITVTGAAAPRQGKELTNRTVVTGIIYNQKNDSFLLLRRSDKEVSFVGGTIEAGESSVEALHREIIEETGYTNFEIKKAAFPNFFGSGYKLRTDKNCLDFEHFYIVELNNEDRQEISKEELAKQEPFWVLRTQVADTITLTTHQYMWDVYSKNKICFSENGTAINSDFLNGLQTFEAKEKMIAWLEEHKIGKRQVNYKLRDWVFSRQRYWGEPIPLVYCENCKNQKQKALLIHGFEASADSNWLPWLKAGLEKQGFEVFVPTLPNSNHPDLSQWLATLQPYFNKLGECDVVVGHSLGSKAALHLLEASKKKIGHVYLVASAIGLLEERDWGKFEREWKGSDVKALRKFWDKPVNWKAVDKAVLNKNLILSDDDPYIKKETHKNLPPGWFYQLWSGFGHFQQKQVPKLLQMILESKNTGWIPLPESELPLKLPKVEKYQPTDTGESPLAAITKWVNTKCPNCGKPAKRETDTMPNWAGSSWYFLRYADPENAKQFASMEKLKYWMSVDWYNGGMEHTVLHLLYSRFWNQFLYDIGTVPTSEPYKKRTSHGMILAKGGEKMSKSRGNVVNPDEMVDQFGADALRTYIMFMGPFDQAVEWDTNGLVGVRRFLEKVWGLQDKINKKASVDKKVQTLLHQTIKKVTEDIEGMRFNTAISKMMELVNEMSRVEQISAADYSLFVKLLSPFAPHICEEIWSMLGHKKSISFEQWPQYDEKLTVESEITLAVQVNGKLRDTLTVAADISEEDAKKVVLASEKIQKWLEGGEPKKIIYVKGKLISIVI